MDREFLDSPEVAEAVRYVTSRRGRPACHGIDFIIFIQDLWADACIPGLTGQTRLRIFGLNVIIWTVFSNLSS